MWWAGAFLNLYWNKGEKQRKLEMGSYYIEKRLEQRVWIQKETNCKQGFPWSGCREGHLDPNHGVSHKCLIFCVMWGLRKWYRMSALPGCPTIPTESGFGYDVHTKQMGALSVHHDLKPVQVGQLKSCLYRLLHSVWDNWGYTQSCGLSVFLFCFAFLSAVYYCETCIYQDEAAFHLHGMFFFCFFVLFWGFFVGRGVWIAESCHG